MTFAELGIAMCNFSAIHSNFSSPLANFFSARIKRDGGGDTLEKVIADNGRVTAICFKNRLTHKFIYID
ncbi:hypothetical protein [Wukongibacter baidiensis]